MGKALISGLANGGVYALLAVGIVLVYKGSRVLNFAQGEMGTFGLFVAFWLIEQQNLPWAIGALGAIAAAGLDRKSTRLNSSHLVISYAVFCLKKKKTD